MKKAMLFVVALFMSITVNAASLNLSTFINDIADNSTNLALSNTSTQAVSFNSIDSVGDFTIGHEIVSDEDVNVKIAWTFNEFTNLTAGMVTLGESLTFVENVVTNTEVFIISLIAGQSYFFDAQGTANALPLTGTLTISAVPVPAAAFLFAPALVGFIALRRKASKAA